MGERHPLDAPGDPDSFGQACKERRAVRPGTHKGPTPPHTAPCHYISGDHPTTRRRRGGHVSGVGARRNVVARGGVGGGWALVGARCRVNRNMSGRELWTPPATLGNISGQNIAYLVGIKLSLRKTPVLCTDSRAELEGIIAGLSTRDC